MRFWLFTLLVNWGVDAFRYPHHHFQVPFPSFLSSTLRDEAGGIQYAVEKKVLRVKPALSVTCLTVPDQETARADAEAAGVDPFGSVVWPAALAAALELCDVANVLRDGKLTGLRVLEIGAGTGLCAFTAAALGANAIASDYTPLSLQLLRAGADAQEAPWLFGGSVECVKFDVTDDQIALPPCDLLVCADMLYEPKLAAAVARRCVEAVSTYGAGFILISPPGRGGEPRFNSVLRKSASAAAATEMGSGGLSLQESLRRAAASFSLPSSPSTSEVPPPSPAPASVSGADDVDDDTVDGKEEGKTGEVEEKAAKVRVGPAEALADALGTQGESSSSEGYLSWDDSVLPSWAEDLWGTPGFGRSPGSMTTEDDAVTQVLRYLPPSLAEGFLSGGEADELVCFHGRMNTMRKMGRRGSRGL
mmetsp:Transcript_35782/g.65474  ORF Transcript_35782/g.65474 Transcript_35782/m.65474 type:complete len:419 (-) Transcript_35782:321-1577(-)